MIIAYHVALNHHMSCRNTCAAKREIGEIRIRFVAWIGHLHGFR